MAQTKQTEIPQEMRELAVHNVDQARASCTQLMDRRKAQDLMKTINPSTPVAQGLSEVQKRAMKFTQQNLDAGFSLAHTRLGACFAFRPSRVFRFSQSQERP